MQARHVLHAAQLLFATVASALLGAMTLGAQTLVVYNVDASGFPTIRANIVALDARGNRVPDLTPADITILEDGLPVTDVTITCPPIVPPEPFHAVLVNDRSGSMTIPVVGGGNRMDLAKLGSSEFVRATSFSSGSTIAITSFESTADIVSDFQTSAPPLLDAIGTITASGGTLYNPPFLDPLVGAIGMLSGRPPGMRRVIVFLTDGQPNEPTRTMEIVTAARNAGIRIYAVTIGMPMSGELQLMSDLTDGVAFGEVNTVDQMRAIYQQIALSAGGNEPCVVTWKSRIRCGRSGLNRAALFTHVPSGASTRVRFTAPESSIAGVEAAPSFVHFGQVGPPDIVERTIVISSPNDTMRLERAVVVPEGAFTVVDWGGSPPPFREPPGSTRTIRVRFAPPDSQKYVASLVVYASPCPPYPITLTGGVGPEEGNSLRLLAPLGGERFSGCDSILIRWGGVAPTTPIDIDASSDDGATWFEVARGATGLEHLWMAPTPGVAWRIRITSNEGSDQHLVSTPAGGGEATADSVQATRSLLFSPTGVAVRGDSMFIAEAGQHRIRRVDLTTGIITTIAGDGNPGSNGAVIARDARLNNPGDVKLFGNYLFIADYANHRVRRINLNDGRIFTVAGTGNSGFGGDSADALLAQLQFPSYIAIIGTSLFVSDAGNLRVRRVDLSSGEIATVAGGGTSTADDIQATSALLQAPAGIAADDRHLYIAEDLGRRIRRVDLRTGLITTVAGTGSEGSTGDGGQAAVATFMRPLGLGLDGGRLYITDSAAHRIRRIDLVTGIITTIAGTGAAGFGGDGGDATLARFNAPGQPDIDEGYLYVPDIHNGRIRAITVGRGLASDSSRAPFAVSVPRLDVGLTAKRFDLGPMAVGQPRDSAAVGALCSTGDVPLVLQSVRIVGTHAGDFFVVSGAPSGEIAPGACDPLEIRFRPSGLGTRTAMAIFSGRCANVDTVRLSGTGVDSCGVSAVELADVGEIVLGAGSRDTLIERAICNTDTDPMSGFTRLVDGASAFEIVDGGGAFMLAPGDCRTVTVRFTPSASGRVTGTIDYGIPAVCGPARTRLYGRALGSPELSMPTLVALPSVLCAATRDTSIALANTGGAPLVISGADFVANDEGFSLLAPVPDATSPLTILPGETAALVIRFAPATPGDKTATLELVTNAPGSPHSLELRGRRDAVALSAATVVAFPFSGAAPRDTMLVVRNAGTADIEIASSVIVGDAASFDVPAVQFPIAIAAGGEDSVLVRLLQSPADAPLRARLLLQYGPTCDSGRFAIDLLAAGTGPALLTSGPEFRPLLCPDELARDTTIVLMNAGQQTMVVSSVSIVDDTAGVFSVSFADTVLVEAGEDTTLAVRFSAGTPGVYGAGLKVVTNARDGIVTIPLIARRERIELAPAPARITMAGDAPGTSIDGSTALTNSGTTPLSITVTSMHGIVTITSDEAITLGPNGSTTITVRYTGAEGGRLHDTLVVREGTCGIEVRIPVEIMIALPSVARLTLPHMTARPGDDIVIPVTIEITDAARLASSGAQGYTATVSMYGTVVKPRDVTGATLVSNDYDMTTRRQTIVVTGLYSGGPTLATISARTIFGDTLGTPLTFEGFRWDSPTVGAELFDGAVTIVGSCFDVGIHLVAVPTILKVRPMPAAGAVTLEITQEEWNAVRIVLYDAHGLPAFRLPAQALAAGPHALTLDFSAIATGRYTLAVETPYGRNVVSVVVVR